MLATPELRAAVCAPGVVVTVASPGGSANVTGSVSKAARLLPLIGAPSESVVSEAVMVAVPLGPITCEGLAVAVRTRRGVAVTPAPAVSHPGVPGPVLQPHQFWVAFTVPVVATVLAPVLPVMRL